MTGVAVGSYPNAAGKTTSHNSCRIHVADPAVCLLSPPAAIQEATHEVAEAQDALSAVEVEKQLLEDRLDAITQAGAG